MLMGGEYKYTAFNIVISISRFVKDESLEAFARLHAAMYDFAFKPSKNKARIHFDLASELKKDSPQVRTFIEKYKIEVGLKIL